MIALLPIFSELKPYFWQSEEGVALIRKTAVAALETALIDNVILVSNNPFFTDAITIPGLTTRLLNIEQQATNEVPFMPLGSLEATNQLKKLGHKWNDIIIINYQNPSLNTEILSQVITQYKNESPPVLVSANAPADHPCQLSSYYTMADNNFLHFFEDKHETARILQQFNPTIAAQCLYHITKPFLFDWGQKNVKDSFSHNLYKRTCTSGKVCYQAIEGKNQPGSSEMIWLRQNKNARLLIPCGLFKNLNNTPGQIYTVGAALSLSCNEIKAEAYFLQDTNQLFFKSTIETNTSIPHVIKAVAVHQDRGQQQVQHFDVEIADLTTPILLPFEWQNLSGIAYSLLRYSENEAYDMIEEFPAPDRLWANTGNHRKVNRQTGREITGRQDFPEVVEHNNSLLITSKKGLSLCQKHILNGNAAFFLLPDDQAIIINNHFDLLRYNALTRARKQ